MVVEEAETRLVSDGTVLRSQPLGNEVEYAVGCIVIVS